MNRRALSILLGLSLSAGTAHGDEANALSFQFGADLGFSGESPPLEDGSMWSQARFAFDQDETVMEFVLNLANGENVTGARLHCGPMGTFGPVIVPLFQFAQGSWNGSLQVQATITGAQIIQGVDCFSTTARAITTVPDLAAGMSDGTIFVSITTASFPEGEIWGWVQTVSNISTLLVFPDIVDAPVGVSLGTARESGTVMRIVTEPSVTVTPIPSGFNPPLRDRSPRLPSRLNPP
ncbi:hypothetical protein sS8_4183 [Methylocaldum marinum]|uniref:CHRD domain-containing protein n=1 Tax=Methylocaldum marinum TaxID=1432792 RepID=A0A250KWS5_9GAMM|nr:CHRD domain-containing protein [Methylocaldum marinum]BBA36113.1 hypothetical protein sS8_4183 [Methylocaldum marinum]